jgi:hypothetical protein
MRLIKKDLIDQIFVLIGETRFEPYLSPHNFVADFSWMNSSERSPSVD